MSGGERQMLAIGRALMGKPKLLMLDEPSLGLAPLIVREIFRIISRAARPGVSILLVEQNARAALQVADYAYVLEMGAVAMQGRRGSSPTTRGWSRPTWASAASTRPCCPPEMLAPACPRSNRAGAPHWDMARGALKCRTFQTRQGSVTAAQDEQQHEAAAAGLDEESARLLATLARNIRLFRSQRGMTRKNLPSSRASRCRTWRASRAPRAMSRWWCSARCARASISPRQPVLRKRAAVGRSGADRRVPAPAAGPGSPTSARELFSEFQPAASARPAHRLIGLRGAGKIHRGQGVGGPPQAAPSSSSTSRSSVRPASACRRSSPSTARPATASSRSCLEELAVSQPEVVLATGGGIVVEPQPPTSCRSAFTPCGCAPTRSAFPPRDGTARRPHRHPSHYREAMENIRNTLAAREHLGRMAALAIDTTPLTVDEVVEKTAEQAVGRVRKARL